MGISVPRLQRTPSFLPSFPSFLVSFPCRLREEKSELQQRLQILQSGQAKLRVEAHEAGLLKKELERLQDNLQRQRGEKRRCGSGLPMQCHKQLRCNLTRRAAFAAMQIRRRNCFPPKSAAADCQFTKQRKEFLLIAEQRGRAWQCWGFNTEWRCSSTRAVVAATCSGVLFNVLFHKPVFLETLFTASINVKGGYTD